MRSLYLIDGVSVPRTTALRAVMQSLLLDYAAAGVLLDRNHAVKCNEGLVVKHTLRLEEY